jgi:hypothetical protein
MPGRVTTLREAMRDAEVGQQFRAGSDRRGRLALHGGTSAPCRLGYILFRKTVSRSGGMDCIDGGAFVIFDEESFLRGRETG